MGAPEKLATSNNNSMQRVKVYRLNDDGKWGDHGTGHVTVDYMERSEELGLFVIDEEDNETLLMHPIISDDIYRKEEDTIITWRDSKDSSEIALSFQETKGCWYIWDRICNQQRNLRSDTIHRPKFETLFPPKGDTKKKVEDFLALPVKERTFRTVSGGSLKEKEHSSPLPCESSNTSKMSTGSRFTRTAPYFSLSDIDDLVAGDPVVNVEGIPRPVTKKQKIKPASHEAKKRKVVVEMDNIFGGMGPSEICDKLMAMTRDAVAHISTGIEREAVAGRKETEAKLVEKRKLLEKMEKEKDMLVIKKGRELTEKDEEIARLTNKIAELEGNHQKEMEGFFKEAKVSAAKTVLQARLKMFQDLQEGKEASWDAEKWCQSLRKLTGEEEETG